MMMVVLMHISMHHLCSRVDAIVDTAYKRTGEGTLVVLFLIRNWQDACEFILDIDFVAGSEQGNLRPDAATQLAKCRVEIERLHTMVQAHPAMSIMVHSVQEFPAGGTDGTERRQKIAPVC